LVNLVFEEYQKRNIDRAGMFGVTFTDTNALPNIKNHLQYHYQLGLVEEEY